MSTITKSTKPVEQLILFASSRTSGTCQNPCWEIPIPPRPGPSERVVLSLDSLVIPNRIPLLSASNNSFTLIEDPAGAATEFEIALQIGDYQNIRQLSNEIISKIAAKTTTNTYTMTYDQISEKVTLTASAGAAVFALLFPGVAAGSIANCLGFSALTSTSADGSLTGDARIDLFSDKIVIISCTLPGVQSYISSSKRRSNVIALLPLSSPSGFLQCYKASQSHYRVELPVGLPLTELTLSVRKQADEQ